MKIKKINLSIYLILTIFVGVIFSSSARQAIALTPTSGNVVGTDLIINTVSCNYPGLDQNAIGFYLENEWLGNNQCVDNVSTWNDFISGTYAYPVHIKLIEGNDSNLRNNCPALTPEVCQSLYGISPMGTVTVYENTLPVSTLAPAPDEGPTTGTVNVVKTVINDSGGTKLVSDFPLYVNGTLVVSGVTKTFNAPGIIFSVTESNNANYTKSFSGDCDMNGQFNLNGGQNKFCIVTNDDIGAPVVVPPVPPLIDVVKVPNPLALPSGPGPVTYTYTLRNIGTVPVTNITMVGDTCSPIVLVSGDTNNDLKLDVNETWVHRCTTTLTETHTNTVTATGWANGISAVDIATSTVTVGASAVKPPLIHIVKVPDRLVLPAGGGLVTYTNLVINPGEVALDYVYLNDDYDSPMEYISGDTNGDLKLDHNEVWKYISRINITKTTTDTVAVRGEANGLIARDFSVATVVVSANKVIPESIVENIVPALPETGPLLDSEQPIETERSVFWSVFMLVVAIATLIIIYFIYKIKKI